MFCRLSVMGCGLSVIGFGFWGSVDGGRTTINGYYADNPFLTTNTPDLTLLGLWVVRREL
ncbi:hypothetical protein BC624_10514 [Flavobacterium granuli]|uniref:Uncharacterized protein n=1 Tax=Flavobacterium granuli TaxID=280093 RepID=A0A1M5NIE1_9FLAO|nr:hypothetical protein BC624_10514 [Flavobacterium granuli]SHG89262.1 hypothetical protein SAMN05443373_10514 [Flavobacterium granuli]